MYDFMIYEVIPILAVFYMVVGGIILAFMTALEVATRVFGKAVRMEGSDELADPRETAKTTLILSGMALSFVVTGLWLHLSNGQQLKGQFLLWAILGGGVIAVAVLWRALRHR